MKKKNHVRFNNSHILQHISFSCRQFTFYPTRIMVLSFPRVCAVLLLLLDGYMAGRTKFKDPNSNLMAASFREIKGKQVIAKNGRIIFLLYSL